IFKENSLITCNLTNLNVKRKCRCINQNNKKIDLSIKSLKILKRSCGGCCCCCRPCCCCCNNCGCCNCCNPCCCNCSGECQCIRWAPCCCRPCCCGCTGYGRKMMKIK
ncbi:hypothetical protein Mgra_00009061, partial [Meloidogyne graminicola]